MPRRRVKPDQDLLDAAMDIVREHGPTALTFAALSARVGLAPATLVQRFGTKADLLHAALARAWDLLEAETATADAAASLDASGAVDFLVQLSGTHEQRDYPDQLLVLREDLRDPVLRRRGQAWLASVTGALDRRLDGAAGMGALLVAQWQGTLAVTAFSPETSLASAVRRNLDDLLSRAGADRRGSTPGRRGGARLER